MFYMNWVQRLAIALALSGVAAWLCVWGLAA